MALTLDQALTGISGILVTPYDEKGDVAPHRLVPILDRALAAGLHMPVVNGNTGEFYALTTEEASVMVREVVRLVDGRAPVLAGIGRGIRDAMALAVRGRAASRYRCAFREAATRDAATVERARVARA